ncbi:hypothetical protein DTW90_37190 [Neorhizobium sp. P12A]|uniref:hypothetical protein n=1 Tax=Neorhizobium sp. P12A TaxID=2268027 RepID=UPI0011EC8AA5|nr:hypothetical protein [Neorhizobium sp. P12A]KAA0681158.1 hypothetical protein DTW90_37190 [Neorhizobium sp. P12A]
MPQVDEVQKEREREAKRKLTSPKMWLGLLSFSAITFVIIWFSNANYVAVPLVLLFVFLFQVFLVEPLYILIFSRSRDRASKS